MACKTFAFDCWKWKKLKGVYFFTFLCIFVQGQWQPTQSQLIQIYIVDWTDVNDTHNIEHTQHWTHTTLNTHNIEHTQHWTHTTLNTHNIEHTQHWTHTTLNTHNIEHTQHWTHTTLNTHNIEHTQHWTHTTLNTHNIEHTQHWTHTTLNTEQNQLAIKVSADNEYYRNASG